MNNFIGKKRKSKSQPLKNNQKDKNKIIEEEDQIIDLKFIAKKKDSSNNKETTSNSSELIDRIIKGDELVFKKRREKAEEWLKDLKINLKKKTNLEIIDEINKIINYDNTNKVILYNCLEMLSKMGEKEEFNSLITNSKFCLTKKFRVYEDGKTFEFDLSNLALFNKEMIKFDNDEKIVKEIKETLRYLDKSFAIFDEIKQKNEKFKIENLKFDIIKDDNNNYLVVEKKDENTNINNLCKNIFEFLKFYAYIKQFDYFALNQNIDFRRNQTLYLFNIFNKLYDNIIQLNESGNRLNIIESKFKIYNAMKKFKNNIFEEIEKNKFNLNINIEKKIRFIFFCLKSNFSDKMLKNLDKNIDKMIKQTFELNKEKIENFIKNNKEINSYLSVEKDDLIFNYKNQEYKFNIKIYNESLLMAINNNKDDENFLDKSKWNPDYFCNFFDENDISYMKYLIKKILRSKLFKQIWEQYSDVQGIVDYYFSIEENIDELLNNIDFYPYDEDYFKMQGLTLHYELKMIISGIPISTIKNEDDFYCYKILETARKIVIILHEVAHYIKRSLKLITNNQVFNTTFESFEGKIPDIEAGRILENILFGFPLKKNAQSSNKDNKNKNSDIDKINFLNLRKGLKILNSKIYENDIATFKEIINNEKELEEKDMDEELLKYIKNVGFDLNDYFKNHEGYEKYIIDCSRGGPKKYYIFYRPDNHNFKKMPNFPKMENFEELEFH